MVYLVTYGEIRISDTARSACVCLPMNACSNLWRLEDETLCYSEDQNLVDPVRHLIGHQRGVGCPMALPLEGPAVPYYWSEQKWWVGGDWRVCYLQGDPIN